MSLLRPLVRSLGSALNRDHVSFRLSMPVLSNHCGRGLAGVVCDEVSAAASDVHQKLGLGATAFASGRGGAELKGLT